MGDPGATDADSERELRRLAYRDHLTGLPNRASMHERIGSALKHAEREGTAVVVLFCDLDGIKLVNDTLGHALGDQVLADVADRLRTLAGSGVTAGRQGGDEFLLLIEDLPGDRDAALAEAAELGRRLADAFTAPFSAGGATFELTASAGAARACFSLLKTDVSFMRRVPEDDTAVELLQAMAALGKTLGLVVIVEGVETEPQLECVLEIGVRVAQGFLFAHALPPAEIEARYGPAARPWQEA